MTEDEMQQEIEALKQQNAQLHLIVKKAMHILSKLREDLNSSSHKDQGSEEQCTE